MNADQEQIAHEIPAEDRDFPDEVNKSRRGVAGAAAAAAAAAARNDIDPNQNNLPANEHPGNAADERRAPPGDNYVDGGPGNHYEGSAYPNGQYFPPFDHTGGGGMPFYPPAAFGPVNQVPPMMLPHPHPSHLPIPAGGPATNLDATRQFYEARMREHAVQYANAAACASAAAWAMAGRMNMGNVQQQQSYYMLAPPEGLVEGGNMTGNQGGQKRTLWEPPSDDRNQRESKAARRKSGYQQSSNDKATLAENRAGRSENKKRNKKRESNDSISSLGSESHDQKANTGKKPTKKGRRRFKEEPGPAKNPPGFKGNDNGQKRGLSHGHSSKSSFSSLGSNNKPPRRNKKNKSAQQQSLHGTTFSGTSLSGLIGKNATCALNELCAKYKWQSPQFIVEEATNTKDDYLTVMTVRVNNVDLGKGSGSNKAIARQDASRRALAALLPGVVFDPNGILQDVGRGIIPNMLAHQGSMSAMSSLSADELGQQVASQLSIGGARKPACAEDSDSSISTAFGSTHNESEGNVFSGGPLSQGLSQGKLLVCQHHQSGRPGLSSSYHASTSGMSSASDVDADDDNAFYASRGASVCSTLLHAMWQIDERIKQPPSYEFMANNVKIDPLPRNNKKSKRKKDENSDGEGAKSGARNPLATRSPFVCTCILNVYFQKDVVDGKDAMSCWETPLDFLQADECQQSDDQCDPTSSGRKRKDALPAPLSPHCSTSVEEDVEHDDSEEHPPVEYSEKFVLRGVGTGNTKREAKHKSSANMLALLFPNCRGLVEVKAAAEAARECYASRKAKRARLEQGGDGKCRKKRSESFSLHELTLSEGSIKCKKPPHDTKSEILHEVDAALQSLLDGRVKTSSIEDIGKIILRRAGEEDADYVHALLSKEASEASMPAKKQRLSPGDSDCDEHTSEGLLGEEKTPTPQDALCNKTIILVLSRAIAVRDPPLGCAILRLSDEKTVSLVRLECEAHVPRERFVDCLETFSSSLDSKLDSTRRESLRASLSLPSIRSFLSTNSEDNIHIGKSPCSGTMPPSQLQSVKEEESEEVDESCQEEEKSPLKKVKRSRVT